MIFAEKKKHIWIHQKLKIDYLKKEKGFQSEIKDIFPFSRNALLDIQNKSLKM